MNNLELTVTVIAIAVAQALTILLTIGRERDIKELRELVNELREHVDEQRLRIVELRAWLAGRNAVQPSRITSERESIASIKAPELMITPKDIPETIHPRPIEDEAAQAIKAHDWSREIVAGLRAGLKVGAPPEPAITTKDSPDAMRPSTAEDGLERATKAFKWFKEDAGEPHEIGEAREIVAGLKGGAPAEPAITTKDLPDAMRPSTAEDELERATKAINWLKEDAEKARETVASLHGTPPEKTG
jgi:ribosomal protein L29